MLLKKVPLLVPLSILAWFAACGVPPVVKEEPPDGRVLPDSDPGDSSSTQGDSRQADVAVPQETGQTETVMLDTGEAPDCKLSISVPDFNTCGCQEEAAPGQCGRMLTDEQVISANVTLTCPDGIENPGIYRVVLNQIPAGASKVLLDVKNAPSPGTDTYEFQFLASATYEGVPHFLSGMQTITLEVAAFSESFGEGGPIVAASKKLKTWVDINGPQVQLVSPAAGLTGGPYINQLPWEFVAGDDGAGLTEVALMLDWLMVGNFKSPESPFTAETYTGVSPFTVLSNTTAQFRIITWDCLGNRTTVNTPVKLVAAPPSTDTQTVSCAENVGNTNNLSVGQGDAGGGRLDLLASAEKGVLVAWGNSSGALFDPLVKINAEIKDRFVGAQFINCDGDGHPDIVALRRNAGGNSQGWVTLFRQEVADGTGLRTFIQVEEWKIGLGAFEIAVCDLDGDGRDDVVVAHPGETDSMALLFGTGKSADPDTVGDFLTAPEYLTGVAGATDMQCADVGGNELPDVIVVRGTKEIVSVFLNLGSGQFGMALNSLLLDKDAMFFDLGHFNEDGFADIAVFIKGLRVAYPLDGKGNGYFEVDQFSGGVTNWKDFGQSFVSGIIGDSVGTTPGAEGGKVVVVGQGTNSLVAADLDGDGIEDLALSDEDGDQIQIFYGREGGKFIEGNFAIVGKDPHSLVAADFNNSGREDLAFLSKDKCQVGLLLSKSEETYQLPCSGKGQCTGSGDGSCDCHCACVCSGQGLCGWKCQWRPALDTCGPAPACPGNPDQQCSCFKECECKCSDFGQLSCPWKLKFQFSGAGTCTEYPGCTGDPDPDCACKDKCYCGCTQAGAASCSPASKYVNVADDFLCEGDGQCSGDGQCKGVGDCAQSVPENGQCVCTCGCQCQCQCECHCTGSGEPYCYWNCKQDCKWDCHVETPKPFTPWSTSRELPLPVKSDFTQGRLRPVDVEVGDLDLDGIPDIVVATELLNKWTCEVHLGIASKNVRPVVAFMGNGQTLTKVYSHHSFSSPQLTEALVGFQIANMDGDEYPDLVLAVKSWATSEKDTSVNFDVMKGASALYDEPPWSDPCTEVAGAPGSFTSLGGYIFEGQPGALATGYLDGDVFHDIILAADGKGSMGSPGESPNRVGVLLTRADHDWATDADYTTAYFDKCLPAASIHDPSIDELNCQDFYPNDNSWCWSYCEPDDVVEAPLVGVGPRAAVLGDVNNDWVTDAIVVFESSGDISLFRGSLSNGEYKLTSPGKPPQQLSLGVSPKDVALGDVDGDGWLDLVAVVDDAMAIAWGIDGSNFQVPKIFEKTVDGSVLKGLKVETGDVNKDGRDEVVVLSRLNSAVYVFTSDGSKQLQGPAVYTTGGSPVDLAVHDMNLDGCADFIVATEDTRTVSVILSMDCF